ncbi:unnamed protein product, partial [Ectocarpus sp. 12 AP-2014]
RNHRAASHDYGDEDVDENASTSCSVATFEDFYLESTQAADALPVVEGRMSAEETKGASMAAPPPLAKVGEVVPPSEETIRRQQRQEERRAERVARLELKRERARRGTTSLDCSSISTDPPGAETSIDGGPPSGEILVLLPRRKIGGSGGVGDPEDDASLDPSVSSLGTYDERSGSGSGGGAPRNLQSLEQPPSATATGGGGGGGRLPAVLPLPPAADLAEELRRRPRRRSRLVDVPPIPPSPTAASVSTGGGVQSAFVSYSTGDVPTGSGVGLNGGALAERGRSLSRLGIAFGGASKRRRSRGGGGGSSIGASGAALAALGPAASGSSMGLQPLAPATIPAVGIDGNGTSSAGAAVAPTVALLKGKIKEWRRRKPRAAPTVPPPLSATLTPVVDDDRRLSRGFSRASASPAALLPPVAMADGDSGGGGAPVARDVAPAAAAATLPPPMALIPVEVGKMDGERTLSDSLSAISSLAGSTQAALTSGTVDSGTVSRTVSGTPTLGYKAETSAAGGSSATATATAAPIAGGVPGMGQAGAGMDGGGGGGDGAAARGQHDGDQPKMTRKKRRSGFGSGADTGNTQGVHKINLGSKKDQMTMTHADRTALMIGACEWGDLEALQRLLELGASPLDLYSPSVEESRCVFCQFFLFLLQVGAGLRSRLAPDDSLHDRALSMLIQPSLEKNRRFLSGPQLRDQDEGRGFCLVHHAAAFGNANKV